MSSHVGERSSAWVTGLWTIPPALLILGGLGVAVLRIAGTESYEPNRLLGSIALGGPYVAAGVIALRGVLQGRAALVAGGGLGAFALALVSLILWPLVIPAGALIVRSVHMARQPNLLGLAEVLLVFGGLFSAITVLVVGDDPAGGTLPDGGEWSASDVITAGEAWTAMVLVALTGAGLAQLERRRPAEDAAG